MQFRKVLSAAIFAIALTGATARGESISFDFTTVPIGLGSLFTYTSGGLSLKVTGTNKIGTTTSASLITRSIFGLGVLGAPAGNPIGMDHEDSTESLVFDFSPHEVVINKMSFKFIDTDSDNDDVLLTVWRNGSVKQEYDISKQGTGSVNFDFTKATPLLSAEQRTGMKFVASTTDWNDNYTIAGLVVEYMAYVPPPVVLPPPPPPPVVVVTPPVISPPAAGHVAPLPPTVWGGAVLLSLSGCIAWARKRRNTGEITSA